jgi:transposase
MVERGYNRDHDLLPQVNFGVFSSENTKIPLYYSLYDGSIPDKANLPYVLQDASDAGLNNLILYLDGAFATKPCFDSLKKCNTFVVGMPLNLAETKNIASKFSGTMHMYNNYINMFNVYYQEYATTIHGVVGKAIVYFDYHKLANQMDATVREYQRNEIELLSKKQYPEGKLKKFQKYFVIKKGSCDGRNFSYTVDQDKFDKYIKYHGYFMVFTNNIDLDPKAALYSYRGKDVDEKVFDQMKNDIDGDRLHVKCEDSLKGKLFVIFIALIIRSKMLHELSGYLSKHSMSFEEIMDTLDSIEVAHTSSGYKQRCSVTKKAREILAEFGCYDLEQELSNLK